MNKNHATVSPAVFKIKTASGSGTGFYLHEYQLVVTNHHVIAGNRKVALEDMQQDHYLAHVVFTNPDIDIALLKVEGGLPDSVPEMQLAADASLTAGDSVHVLGFPFGMPFTVTQGIVSSPRQLMDGRYFIQTDAAVNPGNSGGPVLNAAAEVVGVTTAKFTNADNVGFAIPLETLLEALGSMEDNPEQRYALQCHSCQTLLFQPTDYCPNCGTNIDATLFEETELTHFARFVESALSELGMDPALARAGYDYWVFHQGSSQIRVFVFQQNYLYATSPLNRLPKANLEKLYSYLLSDPVPPYSLAINDSQIYLSYRVHVSEIFTEHAEEIKANLTGMALKADEMDNFFIDEFGAEMTNYSKEV
ncbi:MAG: trypsin-like peptidase domain-containing protein [Bacteroidota bacterium]